MQRVEPNNLRASEPAKGKPSVIIAQETDLLITTQNAISINNSQPRMYYGSPAIVTKDPVEAQRFSKQAKSHGSEGISPVLQGIVKKTMESSSKV